MTEPKKRGGQLKQVAALKRNNISVRMTDAESSRISRAAEINGRTVSDEIKARLDASFDQPALIDALAERLEARRAEYTIRQIMYPGSSFDPPSRPLYLKTDGRIG